MGRYTEAVMPLRRLVELAPSDAQGRQNLAIMEKLAAAQARAEAGRGPPDVIQSVDTLAHGGREYCG